MNAYYVHVHCWALGSRLSRVVCLPLPGALVFLAQGEAQACTQSLPVAAGQSPSCSESGIA